MPQRPNNWTVYFTGKAKKQRQSLPETIVGALAFLVSRLETQGPVQPDRFHFGKIQGKQDVYHCHLNKGKPRYVAVWKVIDKSIQIMEIIYVGTHENADYRRIH